MNSQCTIIATAQIRWSDPETESYSALMTDVAHQMSDPTPLLGPGDLSPFELLNPNGSSPLILVCDHAGLAVPKKLGDLGLPPSAWERHISHDIGARRVTEILSAAFDAPAVMHNYSRLVIDCNRPLGHPESIIAESDGQVVPGNADISSVDIHERAEALFWPYHKTISNLIGGRWRDMGSPPILFSVHSFTGSYGTQHRPWDAGVLYNKDPRLAKVVMEQLLAVGLNIGENQPYSGLEAAYSIDVHGGAPGIAHMVIEMRQDQVADETGCATWAERLTEALTAALNREEMHRVQRF